MSESEVLTVLDDRGLHQLLLCVQEVNLKCLKSALDKIAYLEMNRDRSPVRLNTHHQSVMFYCSASETVRCQASVVKLRRSLGVVIPGESE